MLRLKISNLREVHSTIGLRMLKNRDILQIYLELERVIGLYYVNNKRWNTYLKAVFG